LDTRVVLLEASGVDSKIRSLGVVTLPGSKDGEVRVCVCVCVCVARYFLTSVTLVSFVLTWQVALSPAMAVAEAKRPETGVVFVASYVSARTKQHVFAVGVASEAGVLSRAARTKLPGPAVLWSVYDDAPGQPLLAALLPNGQVDRPITSLYFAASFPIKSFRLF
jgi:hypothetical protein